MGTSQGLVPLAVLWAGLLLIGAIFVAAWHIGQALGRSLARRVDRWAARSGYKVLQFELVDMTARLWCSDAEFDRLPRIGRYQQLYHIRVVTTGPTDGEMTLADEDGRCVTASSTLPAGVHREGFVIFGYPDLPCFSAIRGPLEVRWCRPRSEDPMWDEAVDR